MRSVEFEPLLIPVFVLIPYLVFLAMALKGTGQGWVAFFTMLTVGGVLRALENPQVAGICLAVSYGIAAWGLRRSLIRFREWDLDWWEEHGLTDINAGTLQEKARQKLLGWPFEQLSLKRNDAQLSVRFGLAIAILLGWGTHIAMYYKDGGGGPLVWQYRFLLGMPCAALAFGRAITYCNGYLPPISFWGRLFTFRWLIPRYDQVFGPSLLIVLVGVFGSSICASVELPLVYGVPVLLAVMTALALTMPPSLDDWRLTGGHRVIPQLQNQKTEMVQTQ